MADEEAHPKEPPEPVLEITWEDLQESPAPGPGQFSAAPPETSPLDLSEEFPPVEAGVPLTDSRQPWIEITAVCGRDHRAFVVRFTQTTPEVYTFAQAVPLPPSPPGKFSLVGEATKAKAATGGGPQGQAEGRFDLAGYQGCPCCGRPGLVQCDRCGTIMCGAVILEDRQGLYCHCPHCGGRGRIASSKAVTVQGQVGGVKDKK